MQSRCWGTFLLLASVGSGSLTFRCSGSFHLPSSDSWRWHWFHFLWFLLRCHTGRWCGFAPARHRDWDWDRRYFSAASIPHLKSSTRIHIRPGQLVTCGIASKFRSVIRATSTVRFLPRVQLVARRLIVIDGRQSRLDVGRICGLQDTITATGLTLS